MDDGSGGWRSRGSGTIIILSGGEGVVNNNLTCRIGYITWWYDCDTACILNNTMVGGGGSRLLY